MVGFSHPFHTRGETFYQVLAETKAPLSIGIIFPETYQVKRSAEMNSGLPTGAVTFLFTDIEGSTRLFQ
jgi:hypothetical protein